MGSRPPRSLGNLILEGLNAPTKPVFFLGQLNSQFDPRWGHDPQWVTTPSGSRPQMSLGNLILERLNAPTKPVFFLGQLNSQFDPRWGHDPQGVWEIRLFKVLCVCVCGLNHFDQRAKESADQGRFLAFFFVQITFRLTGKRKTAYDAVRSTNQGPAFASTQIFALPFDPSASKFATCQTQ